jgi:hypothetical protein
MLLSFGLPLVASAEHGESLNGCPSGGFHLHHAMSHDQDHDHAHQHIGSDTDINGDEYICVKPISETTHLHIDNNVPFRAS